MTAGIGVRRLSIFSNWRSGTSGQRVTGVRVRETVPDTFLDRSGRDLTRRPVEELHTRVRQCKVYKPDKGERRWRLLSREQHFYAARAGARAWRQIGDRQRHAGSVRGWSPRSSQTSDGVDGSQRRGDGVLRGARSAGASGRRWYAVTWRPHAEAPGHISSGRTPYAEIASQKNSA